ncbi:MAG: PKD domain-containing protein [Bacteroidia bacterium]
MINITLLSQERSTFKLDLKKRSILVMLSALFSSFYHRLKTSKGLLALLIPLVMASSALAVPIIQTQPGVGPEVCISSAGSLTVVATAGGGGTISYQWQKVERTGATLPGDTAAVGGTWSNITSGYSGTYTAPTLLIQPGAGPPNDLEDFYRCVLVETGGSAPGTRISRAGCLTVITGVPTFSVNPTALAVCEGSAAEFFVTVNGPTPPANFLVKYQWQVQENGAGAFNGTNASNANTLGSSTTSAFTDFSNIWTNSFKLNAAQLQLDDQDVIRCAVTNVCGTANTSTALLTVDPIPNAVISTSNPQNLCQSNALTPSISVTNAQLSARRASANIGWTVDYIFHNGFLNTNTSLSVAGVGNISANLATLAAGAQAGCYNWELSKITYDLSAVVPDCFKNLTVNSQLQANVFPHPTVNFTVPATPVDICETNTASVTITVGNAAYVCDGSTTQLAWNGTFASQLMEGAGTASFISSAISGTGNGNFTYTTSALSNEDLRVALTAFTISTAGCKSADSASFPRTKQIRVFPQPNSTISSTITSSTCQNGTISIPTISVSNAVWNGPTVGSTNMGWSLSVSDPTGNVPATLTGSGNAGAVAPTPLVTAPGSVAAGCHLFKLTSITLTNTAGALPNPPVHPFCPRTISGQEKTYNVYPNPVVSFTSGPVDVCEGSNATFTLTVSNNIWTCGTAQNMTWSHTFNSLLFEGGAAAFSIGSPSPATTSGNGTWTFSTTNGSGLLNNDYKVALAAFTSGPNSCAPTAALPEKQIRAFPIPDAAMSTTAVALCQSGTITTPPINVTNAVWNGPGAGTIAMNHSTTITDGTGLLGAGPLNGTGNMTHGAVGPTGGFTPGCYTLTLNSISLTSTAGATPNPPVNPACPKTLVGQSKTWTVNPEPTVTISPGGAASNQINICEGSGSSFTIAVANTGAGCTANASWALTMNAGSNTFEAAANLSSAVNSTAITSLVTATGTGNGTQTVTIPNNLAPGQYRFQINSIATTAPAVCTGTVTALSGILYINVYPKPTIVVNAATTETVCEGTAGSVSFDITNTYFDPSTGNEPFTGVRPGNFTYTTTGGSMGGAVPSTPVTYAGSTGTITSGPYATSTTLTAGTYTLTVNQINVDNPSCSYAVTTNNVKTLQVKKTPTLVINSVATDYGGQTKTCLNSSVVVNYTVGNIDAGVTWSFTITSTGFPGTVTVTGTGPTTTTINTNTNGGSNFNAVGTHNLVFTGVSTTGGPGLYATPPHCTGAAPANWPVTVIALPNVTALATTSASTFCSGATPMTWDATVTNMVAGLTTYTWTITYNIVQTSPVAMAISGPHTVSGTGNGTFNFSLPAVQRHFLANGNASARNIVISGVAHTGVSSGSGPLCSNNTPTATTLGFTVEPMPRIDVQPASRHVCVTSTGTVNYTITGVRAGKTWSFKWHNDNPSTSPVPITGSGSGSGGGTGSFTTNALTNITPGGGFNAAGIYISDLTSTAVTCDSTSTFDDSTNFRVDAPSFGDTLTKNFIVCEGNNSSLIRVRHPNLLVGNILGWDSSHDNGFTWGQFTTNPPGTDSFHTFVNIKQTTQYRIRVKTPACAVAYSRVAQIFVDPRPKIQLVDNALTVCSGGDAIMTVIVTGVPSTENWQASYTASNAWAGPFTGKGSGTFTFTVATGLTSGSVTIVINSISNTSTATACSNFPAMSSPSNTFTATVASASVAGNIYNTTITAGTILPQTVCRGSVITLRHGNHAGSVSPTTTWYWSTVSSPSYPADFDSIVNNSSSLIVNTTGFPAVTSYMVRVKSGTCNSVRSSVFVLSVRQLPTVSFDAPRYKRICEGSTTSNPITVNGSPSLAYTIGYTEGGATGTFGGSTNGSGVHNTTIPTANLFAPTNVIMQSIAYNTAPTCPNQLYTDAVTEMVVLKNPKFQMLTVDTPICIGNTTKYTYNIYDISTASNLTGVTTTIDALEDGSSSVTGTSVTGISVSGNGAATKTTNSALGTAATSRFISITKATSVYAFATAPTSVTCDTAYNSSKSFKVWPATVAGTLTGTATVCKGSNSGSVTQSVAGNSVIIRWEASVNGGSTWSTINNTTTTQSYSNLTTTTLYRAIYKAGNCAEANSNSITITVNELPTITIARTGSANICSGSQGTYDITVANTFGLAWSAVVKEGGTNRTITGTGDGTSSMTTVSSFTSDFTVSLVSIQVTGSPACGPNSQSGTVSYVVTSNPSATLNSVTTPVCAGASTFATFQITTSGIATGVGFTVTYTVGGTSGLTFSNVGSGTFTVATTTPALSASGTTAVTLNNITTTGLATNCATGLSATMNITVDAVSTAGTVSSNQTVCKGANSGTVTVAGHNGTVVRWEYSTNGGGAWTSVSNTTTSLTFSNITTNTNYRAITKNSSCAEIASSSVLITVNEQPTATISITSGNNPICANTAGTYTITTNNTFGQGWSLNVIEGSTARTVTGTGNTTVNFTTLATLPSNGSVSLVNISTTGSPSCGPNTLAGNVTFTVVPRPTATLNSVTSPVCQGASTFASFSITTSNIASGVGFTVTYSVGGSTGNTFSNVGSGTFNVTSSVVLNTPGSITVTLTDITTTGAAPNCNSTPVGPTRDIIVDATSVAGTTSIAQTVCKGANAGTVSVGGHNGSVVRWEYSTNGGTNWTVVSNTTTSLSFSNISTNTLYRAVTKNSACSEINSSSVLITVNELPTATISILTANNPICANTNGTYTITPSNTFGQTWSAVVNEGSSARTITGTGNAAANFTTLATLGSNTTVSLVSIQTTGSPACGPNTISGDVTFIVTPRPTATLNSVTSPVCQGASTFAVFSVTTSNIATGVGFSITYSVGSTTGLTFTNTGSGTFTVTTTTPALNTAGTTAVTLTSITTTGLTPNCATTLTGQTMNITVSPTTVIGTGAITAINPVCKGTNSGSLTFVPGTAVGSVVRWESTTTLGTWTTISNTTNSQAFTNLTQTTFYRVVIKSGVCSEVNSSFITVTVQELPVATLAGSTTICSGTTAAIGVSISNVSAGQRSQLKYLEGTTSKTAAAMFGTSGTLLTSALTTNTDITLVSVQTFDTTISSVFLKGCSNSTLTSTATVNVNVLPTVTLNSVGGPICQGSATTYTVTVSNVPTGQGWSLTGTIDGVSITSAAGTGSGTFTFNTQTLTTTPLVYVEITLITNTTTGCTSGTLTLIDDITVDATSIAGTASPVSVSTVCKGSNSGDVTVTGHNGTVVRWEYLPAGSSTWTTIANTTTTITFTNLTVTTQYRAVTRNGACNEINSSATTITVRELPTGTISGSSTVCQGTTGNLTVTVSNSFGNPWTVTFLEGTTTRTLTGTGDGAATLTTLTLSTNTDVTLQSIELTHTPSNTNPGNCANSISSTATVNVIPLVNATLNSVNTPVCEGSTSSFAFTVSNIATGQAWSMSYTEGGVSKTATGSGPGTYSLATSSLTTPGSVVITLNSITITSSTPNCTRTLSGATGTIIVDATTVAGTIAGAATVCKGSNSGTLTYSGGNGAVVRWEYSINSGSSWSATGTTATTFSYSNLTQTTDYRVIVKNGSCLEAISAVTTITVREQPMATISGSTTICQGTSTTLTIAVSNSFGNPWSITYLEGTTTNTFTGSGDGNKTLTTATLSSTSDITLQSITLTHSGTSTNPACGPNTLTSTATVNVTPLPTATLNKVVSPICQGNTSNFEFTVSNLSTGQGWSLSYTEGSTSKTTSGNGPGTYTVTTSTLSTAGTVTITLNSISTTSLTPNCTRTLTGQTMDITVNPTTTVGTLGTDVTVCKNTNSGNLSYNVGSSNGAVVRWESSVISASGPWTAITNTTNAQAYLNISQTTYYRVVVKSGTCAEKESNVITISVQEIPVAIIGGSTTICAGNTSTLSVSISNVASGQRSVLSYLEGTTSKTINIFGASGSITTSVLNTNTDITLVSVSSIDSTISSVFRKGCANNALTSTATVNVNPLPNLTLTSVGGPICQGNATTYVVTVSNVPTGQGWSLTGTIEGVSITSPTGTGSGTFTFNTGVLNTPTGAEVKFTLITNTTTGCTRTVSEAKTIKVDATTTVGTISGSATVCKLSNAGSLTYTAGSSNGAIVGWEYSTVSPSTNFNGISNTSSTQTYSNLSATTYYRIIVKNGECARVASNVETITVRELPNATIAGNATICEGSSTNFTITISNTFGQSFRVTYLIGSTVAFLDATGDGTYTISTGVLTATTDITLISIVQTSGTPQCSQNLNGKITITVNDLPRASYTNVPSPLCQGSKISFTFDVSKVKTSQNWSMSYDVKAPSSAGASSESTSGSGSGTYSITTTASVLPTTSTLTLGTITNTTTGCSRTLNDIKVINVDATTVGGTTSAAATVCKGSNTGTISLSGNTGAVVRWESSTNGGSTWTAINNTTSTNAFSNITQTTMYRAFVMNGVCNGANSTATTITVNELPMATVNNATICAGNTASLSVVVTNTFGQSWTLSFVEGSTARTLTGTGDGTFTLTTNVLTATTTVSLKSMQISTGTVLCSNTLSGVGVVTVNDLPTATHDSAPSTVCDGSPVDFTVNVNDVVAGQSWTINYRINSGSTNTKSGTGPGNFTITSPNFTNTSSTMRVDTIKIVSITNTTTGCLKTATLTRTIEVYPKSVGGTTAATVSPLCANTTTTSDITVSGFVGKVVRWEYSDDAQATWTTLSNTSSTITVSNLGKTRVYRAVILSGPCLPANSAVTTIVVIPTVDAQISGAPQICAGKVATFNVLVSNIASTDNWSLTYRVNGTLQTAMTGKGPGNYALTVGPPTTNTAGTIVVKLETITNTTFNCANNVLSSQAMATVNPNPAANFTFANSCKDSVAVFNNSTTIASGTIASYNWNFGDGSLSKDGNPTHAYTATGNYPVSLLAISASGCRDSITKTITVNPRPVADFTFKNTCQDTAAKFVDGSSIAAGGSIVSRFWNFGDGSTVGGNVTNPTHNYAASGTYTITLTVVSNNGCASVKVRNITIFTLPEPNFVGNPVCQNNAMKFINTSSIGVGTMAYKWDFAGQGNSNLTDPVHTFTGFGSFNVSLTATSSSAQGGCVKTLVKPVIVWANPIANFTVADVCIGETSRFVNTSSMPAGSTDNILENYWSFGDSTFSTGKDPMHTYAKDGIYSVLVRATSNRGCINSVTKSAVVHPLPVVTITTPKPNFCDGDSSVLTSNAGMRQYQWSLNGTLLGTNQTQIAKKTGWYKVRIWAPTTLGGCTNEDSIFITAWTLPIADAGSFKVINGHGPKDTLIDLGQSVMLNGKGAGLNGSYSWSPATFLDNAAIARPTSKPDESIKTMGNTILYTLTVTDKNLCVDSDTVRIRVRVEFVLKVHNVITPNNDGLNDTWIIDNIEMYPDAEVGVFNRYGMEVFKTKGYKNGPSTGWDGTNTLNGGEDLPDGAYYYVITMAGTDLVYTGAINLIRSEVK